MTRSRSIEINPLVTARSWVRTLLAHLSAAADRPDGRERACRGNRGDRRAPVSRLVAASLVALSAAGCGSDSPVATDPTDTAQADRAPEATSPDETASANASADDSARAELDAAASKPGTKTKRDAGPVGTLPPNVASDAGTPASDATPVGRGDALALDAARAPGVQSASCLGGITDYESPGPFEFTTESAGAVKLWVPTVPAGCKVPVIHLANGTTARCFNYQKALERMATHGFLTTCYENPNTGAGTYGITAFETALSMYPDLADNRLGSTGHSQGGQAALVTLQLAEAKWGDAMIYAGLAMEPASGYGTQPKGGTWQSYYAEVRSPVFMFSGDSATGYANSRLLGIGTGDGLVGITWVQEGFDALSKSVEAYHWTSIGATHIPTPEAPQQQISIPWFRWKLLGDAKACAYFKAMPDGKKWKSQKEMNSTPCE